MFPVLSQNLWNADRFQLNPIRWATCQKGFQVYVTMYKITPAADENEIIAQHRRKFLKRSVARRIKMLLQNVDLPKANILLLFSRIKRIQFSPPVYCSSGCLFVWNDLLCTFKSDHTVTINILFHQCLHNKARLFFKNKSILHVHCVLYIDQRAFVICSLSRYN